MDSSKKLHRIKLLHTAIWFVMAVASLYVLYAGIVHIRTIWLWISIALLVMETVVLLVNHWTCPLTPIAKQYTNNREDNFDIYLPKTIARYNKIIFGAVFIVGVVLVILDLIRS